MTRQNRTNCDKLQRSDDHGQTYFEVRAEEGCGNQGGIVPMFAPQVWAKSVTVRAESYWMIRDHDNGAPVFPDGTGPGAWPDPGPADPSFRGPGLRKWSLIARWVAIDGNNVTDLSGQFEVGYGGTFNVPIPQAIVPAAGSGRSTTVPSCA
jgi:hypothetical protein